MAPLLSLKYMEAMGPCRFVGGSVSRLGIPYAWALPLLTTCRHLPRPAHQSGSFLQSSAHMGPSTLPPAPQPPQRTGLWPQGNSRVADLFLAAPLRRIFAQQPPRVAALADCWRLRFAVAGGIGGSLQLDPSELNLQKASCTTSSSACSFFPSI